MKSGRIKNQKLTFKEKIERGTNDKLGKLPANVGLTFEQKEIPEGCKLSLIK